MLADPFSGTIYVFRAKRADRVKLIYWNGTGVCLFAMRLEDGKFRWASIHDGVMRLTAAEFLVTGRLWTYVRDDRPFAGSDPPAAVFFASRERTGAHPKTHLAGFAGILQADAHAGFNRLYAPGRKPGPIVEAGCFAHARRKLFDLAKIAEAPIAAEAVARIDVLFAFERKINGR